MRRNVMSRGFEERDPITDKLNLCNFPTGPSARQPHSSLHLVDLQPFPPRMKQEYLRKRSGDPGRL